MTSLKSVLFSLLVLTAVGVAPHLSFGVSSRDRGVVATSIKRDCAQPAMVAGPQCGGDDEKKPKS